MVLVKICGIRDSETACVAVEAGVDFIGLVFFAGSPRNLDIEAAHDIARAIPDRVQTVGLMVDPSDFELNLILNSVDLSFLQLHGSEPPERVAEIRAQFGLPVMKALKIGDPGDVVAAHDFEDAADWMLFDAVSKPLPLPEGEVDRRSRAGEGLIGMSSAPHPNPLPEGEGVTARPVLPGGNGQTFDWSLLAGQTWRKPWMLSGGLNPANVAEAIRVTGAKAVDVSSGVEDSPGIKNADSIRRFIAAAKGLA